MTTFNLPDLGEGLPDAEGEREDRRPGQSEEQPFVVL